MCKHRYERTRHVNISSGEMWRPRTHLCESLQHQHQHLADHSLPRKNPIKTPQPPHGELEWRETSTEAPSEFVQSRQFLSSAARLTSLIGRTCDVVLLEKAFLDSAPSKAPPLESDSLSRILNISAHILHYLSREEQIGCDSLLFRINSNYQQQLWTYF